ncbi:unnamed protein product, partial [Polarella glacialis]
VRILSNGGDILLTASDDGTVKQLNVLEGFSPSEFFTPGSRPCAVVARGKNVLVGCCDGSVLELARRNPTAVLLRRMELGVAITCIDADPPVPGARVLAVGGGRLAVWLDPPRGSGPGPDEVQIPALAEPCPGEYSAVLLPPSAGANMSGAEDFLVLSATGLRRGPGRGKPCGTPAFPRDAIGNVAAAAPLVRGLPESQSFLFAAVSPEEAARYAAQRPSGANGAGTVLELFELKLFSPSPDEASPERIPGADVTASPGLPGSESSANAQRNTSDDAAKKRQEEVEAEATANGGDADTPARESDGHAEADSAEKVGDRAVRNVRRSTTFSTPTVASQARARS